MSFFTLFLNQGHSAYSCVFWGGDISAMKMFFCGLLVWNASDISFVKLVKTLLSSKEHMKIGSLETVEIWLSCSVGSPLYDKTLYIIRKYHF
jgi:hypothetical protein